MTDYISRQAAIDAFLTELTKRERTSLLHTWSTVEVKYFIAKILEQLPSAHPDFDAYCDRLYKAAYERGKRDAQPGWIPCSTALPKENGQYIVTVKYEHVDGYEDIYSEHGEWVDGHWDAGWGHCGRVEKVLAWMPLPKPWEGGQDNGAD